MTEVEDYEAFTAAGKAAQDETAALPAQTQLGPAQAWSELGDDDEPADRPWRLTWGIAALILAALGLVAFTIAQITWDAGRTTQASPTASVDPAQEVLPPTQTTTSDQAFLQSVQRAGIVAKDPDEALTSAHWVCSQLGWMSRDRIRASVQKANQILDPQDGANFVNISTQFYCPQHS